MKLIAQGAEAKIYEDSDNIVKERPEKSYRLKEIDSQLRKSRTNREAKVLKKLADAGVLVPKLIRKEDNTIIMENLHGEKLRDAFEQNSEHWGAEIGKIIRKLHDLGIIHGDLTTSNMIIKDGQVYLIDFGLSFFSDKEEDKAVDLHLLEQAIESKHYKVAEKAVKMILDSYGDKDILKRLEKVKERGRNKTK
jgi:TP53 regulating kinase-like protein